LLLRISISAATMRAEPRVRKTNRRSNQAGETERAAAAKALSGCTRMNKAMQAVPSVIAAATQL
jgi:hypothetical protein